MSFEQFIVARFIESFIDLSWFWRMQHILFVDEDFDRV